MKNNKLLFIVIFSLLCFASIVHAVSTFSVSQGGTGVNTITGIVEGNGTLPLTPVTIGADLDLTSGVLSNPQITLSKLIINGNRNSILYEDGSNKMTTNGLLRYDDSIGSVTHQSATGGFVFVSDSFDENFLLGHDATGGNEININGNYDDIGQLNLHGIRNLLQSAVDSSGVTGLNDLGSINNSSYTYEAPGVNGYSITIDGTNCQNLNYTGASGVFSVSDTMTDGTTGATGTITADDGGIVQVCSITVSTFANGDSITSGAGVTATITTATSPGDTFVATGPASSNSNLLITGSTQHLVDGLTSSFSATTGHTLGDVWTWTETLTYGNFATFNQAGDISIGDPDAVIGGTSLIFDQTNSYVGVQAGHFGSGHGSDVASATDTELSNNGNYIHVTGTTTIKHFKTGKWKDGDQVVIYFPSALTLKHNDTGTCPNTRPLELAGSGDALTAAGSRFTFILDKSLGSCGQWVETARTYPQ